MLHHKAHLIWVHVTLHHVHHILLLLHLLHLHGHHWVGLLHGNSRAWCRYNRLLLTELRLSHPSQRAHVVRLDSRSREERVAGFTECITPLCFFAQLLLIDCHHIRPCTRSAINANTLRHRKWVLVVTNDLNAGLLRWLGFLRELVGELISRDHSTRANVVARNVAIVNVGQWVNSVCLCSTTMVTIFLTTLHDDVVKRASAII